MTGRQPIAILAAVVLVMGTTALAVADDRQPIKDRKGRTQGYVVEKPDGRLVIEDKAGREKGEAWTPSTRERVDPRSITDPGERHYRYTLDTIMGRPWSRK